MRSERGFRRDSLQNFLDDRAGGHKEAARFDENDYRLAAAALLVHISAIDGEVTEAERDMVYRVLKARFELDDEATKALVEAATAAEHDAVDLYHFTRLLNRNLDEGGRLRIVEMMWEIVFADGKVDEFEDNVVWRASDLLGVSARERIELRQRVAAARRVT